jgi:5-dehydro-4-deoxyglucarate dehydratase
MRRAGSAPALTEEPRERRMTTPASPSPTPPAPRSGARAPLAGRLQGLLFFPVTAYAADGGLDLEAFRTHVRRGIDAGAGAVFACCGTGEFHALTPEEFRACVEAAAEEAAGRVPVVAGAGYGTALACQFARIAEEAGADGLLAMPPYLVLPSQEGLLRHYAQLAAASSLEIIVYQRDNAVFTPPTVVELARTPGIIGLKDGVGDLDLLQRVISAVRTELPEADARAFRYFNGLPTAELTGLAYRGLGVTLYSSAVFCFAPEIALAFHRALVGGDDATVDTLLDGFYRPLVELRNKGRGYAVSLVKAGVRMRGLEVGEVRPPLAEPTPAHLKEFAELVERGLALAGASGTGGAGGGR